jgi:hypothetical protein
LLFTSVPLNRGTLVNSNEQTDQLNTHNPNNQLFIKKKLYFFVGKLDKKEKNPLILRIFGF